MTAKIDNSEKKINCLNQTLFCLYMHINSEKQEIFYVGIGYAHRPYDRALNRRNKWWFNIVNKYKYEIIIIRKELTWKEACELEIKYIKQIGRADKGEGTLINMTDGGDGCLNRRHTEEFKIKISNLHKGKTVSIETRVKISNTRKGLVFSKKTKNKISKSVEGSWNLRRENPIICSICGKETTSKGLSSHIFRNHKQQ